MNVKYVMNFFRETKYEDDRLLDYLAETGELEEWYDDAEFLEEGQWKLNTKNTKYNGKMHG